MPVNTYLLAHFYLVAAPAWQQYTITRFYASRHNFALLVWRTRTDGNDGGLWQRAACCRGWKEYTSFGFLARK